MDEHFKIYIERLREGKVEEFDFEIAPDFLQIEESELTFVEPVKIEGRAYLAENELIIEASAVASAVMPCQICNEPTQITLEVHDILGVFPPEEVKIGIFDMAPLLREEILLEVPQFVECNEGNCPKRTDFTKFMKKNGVGEDDEGYHPFKDLI